MALFTKEPRRRRSLLTGLAFAAGAVWAWPRRISDASSFCGFVSPRSRGAARCGAVPATLTALRAGDLTVEEFKARLRDGASGSRRKPSRLGLVLAEFVGHLEWVVGEDDEERELSANTVEAQADGGHGGETGEAMLEQLTQLDARASREDYFDEASGTWDMEGLEEDLRSAQEGQQQQHARQVPDEDLGAGSPDGELYFAELLKLNPDASIEDYFQGGQWDVEGLWSDLELANSSKSVAEPVSPGVRTKPSLPESAMASDGPCIHVGDEVLAHYEWDGNWYAAVVLSARGTDAFLMRWVEDKSESVVTRSRIKALPSLAVGSRVRAIWAGDGGWYFGEVVKAIGDGTYTIKYDDDGSSADLSASAVSPCEEPPPREQQQQLQPSTPQPPPDAQSQQGLLQNEAMQGAELQSDELQRLLADYLVDGHWDMEGLARDLRLAKARASSSATHPAPEGQRSKPSPPELEPVVASDAVRIGVGDEALAYYEEDGNWYAASVLSQEGADAFLVKWDEDDKESVVAHRHIKSLPSLVVGSAVRAIWAEDGEWYVGEVIKVNSDGSYHVKYDEDGTFADLKAEAVRPYEEPPALWAAPFEEGDPALRVGEKTQALWRDSYSETYTDVVVQKDNGDGTVMVKWVSIDGSESNVKREEVRTMKSRVSVDSFRPGQKMKGVVTRMMAFGAFVDVGAERPGLVHVSKLADHNVVKPEDVMKEGQDVAVWFIEADDTGKIHLSTKSFRRPGRSSPSVRLRQFKQTSPSEWLRGKVTRVERHAVFVAVTSLEGSTHEGLVHITNIGDGRVLSVESKMKEGQEVKVRVLDVDQVNQRLVLTMRPE